MRYVACNDRNTRIASATTTSRKGRAYLAKAGSADCSAPTMFIGIKAVMWLSGLARGVTFAWAFARFLGVLKGVSDFGREKP